MADGYLNFDTKINTKGFERGTKSIESHANGLKSVFGKLAVAAAAAFSVKQLVAFGKQSIETASDLAEVQNVVDTAFGESKQKMEDFADTAVKTYGISKLTAKQTGSNYMAMAAGMGLANDSASDMAVALTGLSADMASFYNVEQDVASTALKSIFTGETETLKQFGIVMTDANLQAYALSQGISKSTSEMSQAEKVQLRYNYVMSQTTLAQGDFAKTSDSWANQTRILSEQWKEFGSTIGAVLLNVLLPAVKAINGVLSQLISTAQSASKALSQVLGFDLDGTSADTAASTAQTADNYSDIAQSAEETEKAQEGSLASFDKINKLGDDKSSDSSGGLTAAVTQPATISVDADTSKADKQFSKFFTSAKKRFKAFEKYIGSNFSPTFSGIWNGLKAECAQLKGILGGVFRDIRSLAEPLKNYFSGDFTEYLQTAFTTAGTIAVGLFDSFNTVFSDLWNVAVFPILQNFVSVGLPLITQFWTETSNTLSVAFKAVKEVFDTLWSGVVSPVLGFIAKLVTDTWKLCADAWAKWGKPIFNGINAAINNTKNIFLNVWKSILQPIFNKFMLVLDRIWTDHLKPLVAEFLDFVGTLATGATDIYNKFIAPVVNWFVKTFGPAISKSFGVLLDGVEVIVSGIIDSVKGLILVLKGIVNFVAGVFTLDWKRAWLGVKTIFKGIWNILYSIVKAPINLIIGAINTMTGAIEDAINWIIDGVNSLSFDVPDWVPGIGGETFGFDLNTISIPEIPKLAQGAVIPPNSEFLAILGDQKSGTNIEAPLDTIRQAVLQALAAYGGTGNQKVSVTIPLTLNGRTITQIVVDDINDYIRRNGKSPLKA